MGYSMDLSMLSAYIEEGEALDVKCRYEFVVNSFGERIYVNWKESDFDGSSEIEESASGEVAWWYSDLLIFFNDPNLTK